MYNGVWVSGVARHGELMCVGKDWHAFDPKVCTCTSAHLLLKGYCFVFCFLFYKNLQTYMRVFHLGHLTPASSAIGKFEKLEADKCHVSLVNCIFYIEAREKIEVKKRYWSWKQRAL